jgi:hypothetical protein
LSLGVIQYQANCDLKQKTLAKNDAIVANSTAKANTTTPVVNVTAPANKTEPTLAKLTEITLER